MPPPVVFFFPACPSLQSQQQVHSGVGGLGPPPEPDPDGDGLPFEGGGVELAVDSAVQFGLLSGFAGIALARFTGYLLLDRNGVTRAHVRAFIRGMNLFARYRSIAVIASDDEIMSIHRGRRVARLLARRDFVSTGLTQRLLSR